MNLEKILEYTDTNEVELAKGFADEIGKTLQLNQSDYACEYGTLSDGHERITRAQRYFGAIREMWTYANAINETKVCAMRAHANLVEAQGRETHHHHEEIRKKADILQAESALAAYLVQAKEQSRCLAAFNRVRLSLKEEIEARYPGGIEQAERDNWIAVAKYRLSNRHITHAQNLNHVPLDPVTKAELGLANAAPEMTNWLRQLEPEALQQLAGGNVDKLVQFIKKQNRLSPNPPPPEIL